MKIKLLVTILCSLFITLFVSCQPTEEHVTYITGPNLPPDRYKPPVTDNFIDIDASKFVDIEQHLASARKARKDTINIFLTGGEEEITLNVTKPQIPNPNFDPEQEESDDNRPQIEADKPFSGLKLTLANSPRNVIIHGGGRVVNLTGTEKIHTGSLISVQSPITLVLTDITLKGLMPKEFAKVPVESLRDLYIHDTKDELYNGTYCDAKDTIPNNASVVQVFDGILILDSGAVIGYNYIDYKFFDDYVEYDFGGGAVMVVGKKGSVTLNYHSRLAFGYAPIGGGISTNDSTVYMNGGDIVYCVAAAVGGGICTINSTLVYNAGYITDCIATNSKDSEYFRFDGAHRGGGGIYAIGSNLELYGGLITENYVLDEVVSSEDDEEETEEEGETTPKSDAHKGKGAGLFIYSGKHSANFSSSKFSNNGVIEIKENFTPGKVLDNTYWES
jgi:hypothetical protein